MIQYNNIKVLKLKLKRVKSVWGTETSHLGRTNKQENSGKVGKRAHGLNPMGSDGLSPGSDPQEMLRPFLEQISDTKENGTPAVLLETELPRSRFLWQCGTFPKEQNHV